MTDTPSPSIAEMMASLPPLPLDAFKSSGTGILSGKFPALPTTTLDKIAKVLIDGGDVDWRRQIASKAVMMPISSLRRHIGKLSAQGASSFRFPRGEHVGEAVADLIGAESAKRLKYKRANPGKFIRSVFGEPALIARLGSVWSDAQTIFLDELLRASTKNNRLDGDALMKALDEAVFAPGEALNLAALAVAVARLPLAVKAGLIDESTVDTDDLQMPLMSTLLIARVLANADSALNMWLAKPADDGD